MKKSATNYFPQHTRLHTLQLAFNYLSSTYICTYAYIQQIYKYASKQDNLLTHIHAHTEMLSSVEEFYEGGKPNELPLVDL